MNQISIVPRNFKTDWPDFLNESKITQLLVNVAPFATLYKPLAQPVSLTLNAFRSVTCLSQFADQEGNSIYKLFETGCSLSSLAAVYFNHPMAAAVTSCHDLINDILIIAAFDKPITRSCLSIASNVAYLTFMLSGNMYVSAAYLGLSAMKHAWTAYEEYDQENYFAAASSGTFALISTTLFLAKAVEIYKTPIDYHKQLINIFKKYGDEAKRRNIAVSHIVAETGDLASMKVLCQTNFISSQDLLDHTLKARQYEMANFLLDQKDIWISEYDTSAFILDIQGLDNRQLSDRLALTKRLLKYLDLNNERSSVFKSVLELKPANLAQSLYQEQVTKLLNEQKAVLGFAQALWM